jgi:hypothetical protein
MKDLSELQPVSLSSNAITTQSKILGVLAVGRVIIISQQFQLLAL